MPSGKYYIDALLPSGEPHWNNSPVTYSFMTQIPSYENPKNETFEVTFEGDKDPSTVSNFRAFDNNQIAGAKKALQLIEEVAGITFELKSNDNADVKIRFGTGDPSKEGIPGWAGYPGDNTGGDIWLANDVTENLTPTPGSQGFRLMLHEIGHALGLKHPFKGDNTLPAGEDNNQYTVMSYTRHPGSSVYPQTPMLYDIAAIQYLYGANYNTRTEDNIYSWNKLIDDAGKPFVETIWDAGGIDTISAENQIVPVKIDLHPGSFSSIGPKQNSQFNTPATNNLALTYEVKNSDGKVVNIIENAIGGVFDDDLVGNEVSNTLSGGYGNDTLGGLEGDDILHGGKGKDTLVDFSGTNQLFGGEQDDKYYISISANSNNTITEYADEGIDTVFAVSTDYQLGDNLENLTLMVNATSGRGNDLNNEIKGNSLTNYLFGEVGEDTLNGEGGNDELYGGVGEDKMYGGEGDDYLDGWEGDDTLYSGTTDNPNEIGTGNDTLVAWYGKDTLYGQDGNDWLDGSYDNDYLDGGDGNDILGNPASPDYPSGEPGNDTMNGGNGNDTLYGGGYATSGMQPEYDILTGGADNDIFVLGGSWGVSYQGPGHAVITDWNSAYDDIQVRGSASQYELKTGDWKVGSSALDTKILLKGTNDSIGIVQDSTDLQLGSRDFIFV